MGKGQRSREARAGKREEMKKAAAKKVMQQKIKRIISICVVAVLVIGIVGMVAYNAVASTGYFLRNTVAMATDNFTVDNAMMTYYLKNQYNSFASNNSEYLSMYGLDTSKTLKDQAYGDGTWFDYFLTSTKDQIDDILYLAEKAKAEGYELDDEAKGAADEAINAMKTYAETNKMSLDQYIVTAFGSGINESDIRRAVDLTTYASEYYSDYSDKIEYTNEDLQKFFDENNDKYVKADYITYSFPATFASDATDDVKAAAKADAKAKADALASNKSVDEFKAALEKILTDKYTEEYSAETEEEAGEDALPLEERVKNSVKTDMDNAESTKYFTKEESDKAGLWMFNADTKVGNTYVEEPADDATSFTYKVYILVKPSYFDDYTTVNARHILFTTEKYETAEAAKAKAEEVLKTYNESGKKTEEYFEELAKEHSDDGNVESNGGLYEGVTKDANYPEAFYTWCYDESRKVGDVGIVESDSGAHIMYFSGTGDIAWRNAARTDKENADYEALIKELGETYTLTTNDSKMNKIKA